MKLHIDPEFRDKIPPLTAEEYKQLEENILEDGEVYEPIAVWNGTIVDGHNRWKIICDHLDTLKDKYRVRELDFPDKWAAFEWMYKKQLGRRNLSEEQRTFLIGKMYAARKKTQGTNNQYIQSKSEKDQNDLFHDKPRSTAEVIGAEVGVAEPTVKRAERYSKGIDALSEVSKEAADKVLKGGSGITKKTVIAFPLMEPEEQEAVAESIKAGRVINVKTPGTYNGGGTAEYRKMRQEIAQNAVRLYDPEVPEYTLQDLLEEIRVNAEDYIRLLNNQINDHKVLVTADSKQAIRDAIHASIIVPAEAIRRGINE